MESNIAVIRRENYFKFLKFGIALFVILLLLFCGAACSQLPQQSKKVVSKPANTIPVHPANLPPPIKAKYLDPDSIAPPIVMSLRGQPKVVPAHSNVHPIGTPKITRIPDDLKIITLGKDIPFPTKIPANKKIIPALHQQPVPALTARARDAAIYNIQYLSDSEGFSGGAANSLLEDRRGHIWIGGRGDGIFRYDGENFFRYTEEQGFFNGAITMIEDKKGRIWFTGNEGISYYDGKNVVQLLGLKSLEATFWPCLQEDSMGNIWIGSDKGMINYDGENFTFFDKENIIFKDARSETAYYANNRINDILEDSRGHLWWTTAGSGVLRYDGQKIVQYTKKEGLIDNYISCILEDNQGQIWLGSGGVGTKGEGLSIYQQNRTNEGGFGGTFSNYTTKEGLNGNRMTGMVADGEDNVWIATFDAGVTQYDGENFIHFTEAEGLSNNSILSITKDRKNSIWVGSIQGELNRILTKSFRHFTEKEGLINNSVGMIREDSKGNIWMDSYFGGITKYDGKNFTHYTEKEGLLQNIINGILEDRNGNMWFLYRDKGMSRFDGKTFTHYKSENGLSGYFYWDFHEDDQGQIWVACGYEGGIIRLNPNNGQITHFIGDEKDGIGGGDILEDSEHNLWFGGRGVVAKFNSTKEEITFTYQVDPIQKDWVAYLIEDKKENLWFGTSTSITKVRNNGKELTNDFPHLTIGNRLPKTRIANVITDNNQNLWIAGMDEGIAVLNKDLNNFDKLDNQWKLYNKADGLKSRGFRDIFLDSQNRLWWTSLSGVTQLNLNTFSLTTQAPENLNLSHIDLQGQFLDYKSLVHGNHKDRDVFEESVHNSFDSILAFNNYPTTLNLPFDLNHLTFHFSATDWTAPHAIKYSFLMEGVDKTWSQPTAKTEADYRNLSYGTFTFKVKTIGAAQIWSEPFTYTFTILPPWWHTWWAYVLYALLALGTTGWYIQRLRQQINLKQAQLDRELYLNEELAVSNQQLATTNQELANFNIANSRFVPNDFLQILGKDSLLDLQLGDQTEATMTILFADIRDYTTISEQMSPEDNFKLINAFLGRMGPIIQENGGFICQYMGDGIMALFKENHDLAINAAIEMQAALQRYNKKRFVRNRQALRVGIGLNTGKLMLGVIGDKNRYDSSVISDAVNTASRMEGLTKIFGCGVIVSEKTLAEIEGRLLDDFPSSSNLKSKATKLLDNRKLSSNTHRFLGKVKVKGKNQTLEIYDFFDGDATNIRQLKTETKTGFERAIHHYLNKEFGKAADLLKVITAKFPEDIATEYYLTKSVKYVIDGVDADWNGVEEMINK